MNNGHEEHNNDMMCLFLCRQRVMSIYNAKWNKRPQTEQSYPVWRKFIGKSLLIDLGQHSKGLYWQNGSKNLGLGIQTSGFGLRNTDIGIRLVSCLQPGQ